MKRTSLEPGLLRLFRLYAGMRLGVLLLRVGAQAILPILHVSPEQMVPVMAEDVIAEDLLGIADAALLMIYLSWSWLQHQLGRVFLPGAILIASVGPIVEKYLLVKLLMQEDVVEALMFVVDSWELAPLLFVPLVITAWQYNFRSVILFSFGTAVLDVILTLDFTWTGIINSFPVLGEIFLRTLLFILVGYMIVRLMTSQRELRVALTQANVRLTGYATTLERLTISRERNRLARELHDTLAHTLSAVAIQLEAVRSLWNSDTSEARAMLDQSLTATRTGLNETRRALQALRAAPIEDLGLELAIRDLVESLAAQAELRIDLRISSNLENIPPDVEQCIYRVIQEALANSIKHAEAHHVIVQLERDDHRLALTVSDDGCGFELATSKSDHRLGLKGMRERAEAAGGILEVESRPGDGTTVRLIIESVQ